MPAIDYLTNSSIIKNFLGIADNHEKECTKQVMIWKTTVAIKQNGQSSL
jgi:hypothetical protein